MTTIFRDYDGDEDFCRSKYIPAKGRGKSGTVIRSQQCIVTDAAIDAGEAFLSGRLPRRPRTWAGAQRKMTEYLLALRLPVSRLALVCELSGVLSRRATDPISLSFPDKPLRREAALLVTCAARSILAEVQPKTTEDVWAQFHIVAAQPSALPVAQRKRVAARLSRFVAAHLAGEQVAA